MTKRSDFDFAKGFKAPSVVYEVVGRGDATGVRKVEEGPLYLQQIGRARRVVPIDAQDEADPSGRISAAIDTLKSRT